MGETNFRGPVSSMGSLEFQSGNTATIEPLDGPSLSYQGRVLPDPRGGPFDKDGVGPARVNGFYCNDKFVVVDAIPSTSSTATVAVAQAPSTTAGVALNLATAVLGTAANVAVWAPGVPIIPTNTTRPVTVSVIDFGFTTCTTVANSSTVALLDNTVVTLNQWIVIAGAGSGSVTNSALITQVRSISANGTGITISPVAATALSHAPIGQGNLYSDLIPPGTQFGPATASANATEPYRLAGLAQIFDPAQGVTRNLTVTAASIGSGTTAFLCTGYDVYGVPMTEIITANGTNTVDGKKAFKYVSTIAVQTAATTVTPAQVSIGYGDILGFNLRSDRWEYMTAKYSGGLQINNTGWTSAITATATNTTGDIRGTQNFSTGQFGGAAGSATVGQPFNGVKRVVVEMSLPPQRMIAATPLASTSMFGVTQA